MQVVANTFFPYRFRDGFPDMSDMSIAQAPGRAWLAEIEEPLAVDAPGDAHPWTCYLDTIIFYRQPRGPDEIARCDSRLRIDDLIEDAAGTWRITGGSVAWTKGRWHMVWRLRMHAQEDHT